MELVDTIDMMTSDDYKERFKAEYHQTNIRLQKLRNMIQKWDDGELNFTPTCPRPMYEDQMYGMTRYLRVLKQRAELEGVDLSE